MTPPPCDVTVRVEGSPYVKAIGDGVPVVKALGEPSPRRFWP
jgi:hypothetical protein